MKIIDGIALLNPTEVGQILGVDRRTIHNWVSGGPKRPVHAPKLQVIRGPNRRLYFNRDHILKIATELFGTASSLIAP